MDTIKAITEEVMRQMEMIKELQAEVKALKGELKPETFWDNDEIVKSLNQSTLINFSDLVACPIPQRNPT